MSKTTDFGYIDNTFINLYSKDNPIMEEGDVCYFLFTSIENFHMPIIGKGFIQKEVFGEGMNKLYFIQLQELCDSPVFLEKWLNGNIFMMVPTVKIGISITSQKQQTLGIATMMSTPNFYKENFFKVECFFVRNSIEKILQLRQEYISILKQDFLSQVNDIDSILV